MFKLMSRLELISKLKLMPRLKFKYFKYITFAAIVAAICFINSTNIVYSRGNEADIINEAGGNINARSGNDDKMLFFQEYNCDPKMLVKGNPDIDPKILLDKLPGYKNDDEWRSGNK